MTKGKFVVFEGIDGSGHSTQAEMAQNYIYNKSKFNNVLRTNEPTRRFIEIKERMASQKNVSDNARWFLEMFVKDRKEHSEKDIRPNLEQGIHVFCDRYDISTYCYQHLQGISMDEIREAHKGIIIPDIYFVIDCPADVAFQRRKKAGATDIFEKSIDFQRELRDLYINSARLFPEREIVVIDGDKTIIQVFDNIKYCLDQLFQ